jgi:hypothetical protein
MLPVLWRVGALAVLFALQPISPDYRWFYSQPLIITILVLTVPLVKTVDVEEETG